MAQEIERKFLVRGDFKSQAYACSHIQQGYIGTRPGRTVRIRIRDDRAYLTIKGPAGKAGLSRYEFETEIAVSDAKDLLLLCEPGLIDKHRYLVKSPDGRHTWEVDEFHGDNDGLVMAEIELCSEDDTFQLPDFVAQEVTGDRRYYNGHLRANPYKNWKT
jgi:CYTH domain-containing protein